MVPLSKSGVRKHRGFESRPLRHRPLRLAEHDRPEQHTPAERSPSGRGRRTGNAVWGNPSRVRIPPSPPLPGYSPDRHARCAPIASGRRTRPGAVAWRWHPGSSTPTHERTNEAARRTAHAPFWPRRRSSESSHASNGRGRRARIVVGRPRWFAQYCHASTAGRHGARTIAVRRGAT